MNSVLLMLILSVCAVVVSLTSIQYDDGFHRMCAQNAMSGMGFNSLNDWPSAGLTHVRIWDMGVTWRDIHLNVDVYDWSKLDQVVAQIESVGAKMT
jgi:hypothetical protein